MVAAFKEFLRINEWMGNPNLDTELADAFDRKERITSDIHPFYGVKTPKIEL